MTNITLTGDYGYAVYRVGGLSSYSTIDATGASWIQSNSANQMPNANTSYLVGSGQINTHPFIIDSAGYGLTIRGGTIWGEVPQYSDWQYTYNNSAGIRIDGAPGVIIDDWRIDKAWDGIRIRGNSADFLIDDLHISNVRDDAIENDFALSGTVRDSLFDGVFVGMGLVNSTNPDASGNKITFENVMMRSQSFLYNGEMTHGSFFKTNTDAPATTPDIHLINSIFAIDDVTPIHVARLKLAWDNVVESRGNMFLNLSDTPLPSSYPRPPSGFTILQGQQARDYWARAKEAWLANHDGVNDLALTPLPALAGTGDGPVIAPVPVAGTTKKNNVRFEDFNGDGRSDVLWRQSGGQLVEWLGEANGTLVANAALALARVDNSWTIVASGDFNGDGRDDILWRHALGDFAQWSGQADGGLAAIAAAPAKLDSSWQAAGSADFNGDGRDDILWRHSSGEVAAWLAQADGKFANGGVAAKVDASWTVAGTGDFNGDGFGDVLWRHLSGELAEWTGRADGRFLNNGIAVKVDNSWKIAGTGDFNGDCRDDILWRHTSGETAEWLGQANGSFVNNLKGASKAVGNDWTITGTGDFNGDGRDDIFWHHTSGATSSWLGQADGSFVNIGSSGTVPTDWLT